MNKKIIIILFTAILLIGGNHKVYAQPPSGPGSPGGIPAPPDNSPDVPFDGGLSIILLAAGAGVAKRNLRKTQNA